MSKILYEIWWIDDERGNERPLASLLDVYSNLYRHNVVSTDYKRLEKTCEYMRDVTYYKYEIRVKDEIH